MILFAPRLNLVYNNLWERTGFDLEPYAKLQAEDDGWPL